MNSSSQIEIAKVLKAIKSVSTQKQLDAIINIFSNNDQDYNYFNNAINGLSEEDEFALLTKLMGTATYIIGLEQRPIIDGDFVTPDFLVTFKPNCTIHRRINAEFSEYSCFVEVKSTKSDKYKIGGSRLRKIRNTADKYSLPLIIAVRFVRFRDHALWALIEDDRSKTSFNVTYNDCIQGVRHILWDEYSILLNPTLTLIAEYSIDSVENTVSHSTYGRQNKLILRTSENEVFIEDKHLQILYSVFFECFGLNTTDIKKINTEVTQQYMKPEINLLLLSDITYRINRISYNDDGTLYYDASKILAKLDSNEKMIILDRRYIDMIFLDLVKEDILFYGVIKDKDEHLRKWKEFGCVKD